LSDRLDYPAGKIMGLTIHFKLTPPPDTDAARANKLVRQMRQRAQGFKQRGRVRAVLPIGSDRESLRWAMDYKSVPHPWKPGCQSGIDIPAEEGFLFIVDLGEDCEPLQLALCRYPKTVIMGGRRYRTGLKGWQFKGFSKTQYASLHGWEHFQRCHTGVIDLLHGLRRLGLGVEISDEGDYWPGRNLQALRRNLDEMNGAVAAAVGVMKDRAEAQGGAPVQSPILAHPHFERLEAEGAARGYASQLRKALR
jgi:hypothetical protein